MKKKCTKCGVEKELDEFYNDKRVKKDGKQSACKTCINSQKQIYRSANKEKRNEYERTRRENDPEFKKLASERNARYYQKLVDENGQRLIEYKERTKNGLEVLRKRNPLYFMWSSARSRAKTNNIPFDIEIEDLIIPEYCPILELKLDYNQGKLGPNSYSLDKIIPEKGYVKGNVRIISHLANAMKQNANLDLLEKFSNNILKYMKNEDIVQPIENNQSIELKDKEPLG